MTSYQRRKQDIVYYKQCIGELEEIAKTLAEQLRRNNIKIPLIGKGIGPNTILTPYNMGEFNSTL